MRVRVRASHTSGPRTTTGPDAVGVDVPPDFDRASSLSRATRTWPARYLPGSRAAVCDVLDAAGGLAAHGILPSASARPRGGGPARWRVASSHARRRRPAAGRTGRRDGRHPDVPVLVERVSVCAVVHAGARAADGAGCRHSLSWPLSGAVGPGARSDRRRDDPGGDPRGGLSAAHRGRTDLWRQQGIAWPRFVLKISKRFIRTGT